MYPWHSIVDAPLSTATQAVIVSEDPWNRWARSPIMVPLATGLGTNLLRPVIGQSGVADCTRPITVNESRLGVVRGSLSAEESATVTAALASMLNVDHLINGTTPPQPATSVSGWYPRFGNIHFDTLPIGGQQKMFVILSDDLWNATEQFVIGLRLTSQSKPPRVRSEVPLAGGPVIVGDIHLLLITALSHTPPRPPRPSRCTPEQRAAIGRGLKVVLNL